MDNKNESSSKMNMSKKQSQYSESGATGMLGVVIFFIVMIIVMLVLAHFKS